MSSGPESLFKLVRIGDSGLKFLSPKTLDPIYYTLNRPKTLNPKQT